MELFGGVSPHRPLNQTGKEIRVVKLFPSTTFNAPIECELEHTTLEPGADFEAVSYCWGDASKTRPILLDGSPYPITLNLFNGLGHLRQRNSARRLWVDSLCINQTDTEERSREILKMQDIYRVARRVLIWVGDYHAHYTSAHVRKIFDYVKRVADAYTEEDENSLTRTEKWDKLWQRHSELRKLVQNWEWFQRIWVIQEVAVRPEPIFTNIDTSPKLICGDLSLPYAYLRWIHEFWVTKSGNRYVSLPPVCRSFGYLSEIWTSHHEIKEESTMTLPERIAWILSRVSARFKSTDTRDIMFAIVGLLGTEEIPSELLPNYKKNAREVFIDYATYVLSHSILLPIIQFNSMGTQGLPTWVPDWQHDPTLPCAILEKAIWADTHIRVLRDINAIEVDIIPCSRIVAVGPKFEHEGSPEELIRSWENFFFDAEEDLDGRNIPPEGYTDFGTALWQLLLAYDYRSYDLHDPGWHFSAANNPPPFLAGKAQRGQVPGTNNHFYRDIERDALISLAKSFIGKYIFRADDGSIGVICQRHVEPRLDDVICSIKGAYADFILRECVDGYRIVGICERTLRGCEMAIRDYGARLGFQRWMSEKLLMDFYNDFWVVNAGRRVHIY